MKNHGIFRYIAVIVKSVFFLTAASVSSVVIAAECLYISSYHAGYEWNDGIEQGIESTLKEGCRLDKFYMDTKRNPGRLFAEQSALKAKKYIEQTNPDVIIACDDNASKYLIKPYYRNAKRAFVFCGINWTTEEYGYPYANVTGMVEVAPIQPLLKIVKKISGSIKRGVYLSADVLTEHKDYRRYRAKYAESGVELKGVFVKHEKDWKTAFIKAQDADFIILNNNGGINDWDKNDIRKFVLQTGSVLTVTNYEWMIPYAMLAVTKLPQEQGEWAAQVAQAVLQGESPGDIPVVVNRRWKFYVNERLLARTAYSLPVSVSSDAVFRDDY